MSSRSQEIVKYDYASGVIAILLANALFACSLSKEGDPATVPLNGHIFACGAAANVKVFSVNKFVGRQSPQLIIVTEDLQGPVESFTNTVELMFKDRSIVGAPEPSNSDQPPAIPPLIQQTTRISAWQSEKVKSAHKLEPTPEWVREFPSLALAGAAGDVDGDGSEDVLILNQLVDKINDTISVRCRVTAISGKLNIPIWSQVVGRFRVGDSGVQLYVDLDYDGSQDLLLGGFDDLGLYTLCVLSSRSGEVIVRHTLKSIERSSRPIAKVLELMGEKLVFLSISTGTNSFRAVETLTLLIKSDGVRLCTDHSYTGFSLIDIVEQFKDEGYPSELPVRRDPHPVRHPSFAFLQFHGGTLCLRPESRRQFDHAVAWM